MIYLHDISPLAAELLPEHPDCKVVSLPVSQLPQVLEATQPRPEDGKAVQLDPMFLFLMLPVSGGWAINPPPDILDMAQTSNAWKALNFHLYGEPRPLFLDHYALPFFAVSMYSNPVRPEMVRLARSAPPPCLAGEDPCSYGEFLFRMIEATMRQSATEAGL
jgi:hypothetical protein